MRDARCGRRGWRTGARIAQHGRGGGAARSEEHTSELQSQSKLGCRLLLEKKKQGRPPYPPAKRTSPCTTRYANSTTPDPMTPPTRVLTPCNRCPSLNLTRQPVSL